MLMLTAHGGAEKTGRNTYAYFDAMKTRKMEAIEVDIHRVGGELVIAHIMPSLIKSRRIPLRYVFEYCKEYGFKVNCDVKRTGLVKYVVALAEEIGVTDKIYFTGSVSADDLKDLGDTVVYMNELFFGLKYPISVENMPKIKAYLDSFGIPNVKGINVSYVRVNDKILKKAQEIGLGVSLFTIDNEEKLKEFLQYDIDNVTTNLIDKALELREELAR